MKTVGAIFEKLKFLNFFIWTSLNFEGRSKKKKRAEDNFKSALNIEFEQDLSVDLGATLGDRYKKIAYIILVTMIFPGKANSAILLGFECRINQQNFMNIVVAIFDKMIILNFFLCELPLILRVDRKRTKDELEIFARGP